MNRTALELVVAAGTVAGVIAGVRALAPAAPSRAPLVAALAESAEDATGASFPAGPRRCIASASTVADRLVVALVGEGALCAVATPVSCTRPWCAAFAGKPRLTNLDDVNALAALHPDLVVTANPGTPGRIVRLRDAGLPVFDLGPATGLHALEESSRRLGAVLGRPEVAEALWGRFQRRLEAVRPVTTERPSGLYLGLYGNVLVGGAGDTSWHDVLEAAGLRDAAADRTGWPSWTALDVAERNPAWIVTEPGMGALLCAREGIAAIDACRRGHVAEIDADLLSDPGLTMLDAAEAVADRIAELSARR
jgi:iron complex transport system substrate-binding protein